MESLISLAAEVVLELLCSAGHAANKCIWLKGDINKVDVRFKDLEREMRTIDEKLEIEGRNPLQVVEDWEEDVTEERKNVDKLADEFSRNFECRQQNVCGGGCRNFWHGEKISRQVDDSKPQMERASGYFGVFPYFWHRYKIRQQLDDCNSNMEGLENRYQKFPTDYAGRRVPNLLPPGPYTEKTFEEEMSRIKELLMIKKVQVIGILGAEGERTTSLLKLVHNNNEVRKHFQYMIFFLKAPSSSEHGIQTARQKISEVIGLTGPLSKAELYTRWQRRKFPFLLMLDDLQEGFDLDELNKMVEDIGLPTFEEKHPQIVFSSRSEQVVAAMNAKETWIKVSPTNATELNVQEMLEKTIAGRDDQENFCNTDESSKDNISPVHPLDKTPLFCLASSLAFFTGTEITVACLLIISWLFILILFSVLLRRNKTSRECHISPAESESECSSTEKLESSSTEELELKCSSTEKLEFLSTEELECLSTEELFYVFWRQNKTSREPCITPAELECSSAEELECHSGEEIPQKGGSNCTTYFEWTEQELGFGSCFGRKLDSKSQQEIVPVED